MKQRPEYDAILALGCGINAAGNLSDDARGSVELAVGRYEQGQAPLLIFSGSVSYKADFTPVRTEAEAMRDYALERGVPASDILTETDSKDTLGNAYFSKVAVLTPRGLRRVLIVGGPNHSPERLEFIFRKVWGPDYIYEFVDRGIRPGEQAREQLSLMMLHRWLDDVPDGDDARVYTVMRERHPGYSDDPVGTMEQLRREMQLPPGAQAL